MKTVLRLALSAPLLLLASASLFGWGALVRRATRTAGGSWPTTTTLGVGVVLAIGGIVNLARISYAPTLWAIAVVGLGLFAIHMGSPRRLSEWLQSIRPRRPADAVEDVVTGGFVALILAFTVATQLPPDVFNFDDDLQKYFAHPVRMLATGTLRGSPLSALGSRTLGGMAFLHGFVLSAFPIQFINGVDAVLGLGLAMCLVAAAGRRRLTPLPGALLAPLLLVCINPQYVNVTALFLGAALMASAVMLVADKREPWPPPAALLGLIYAGLVALKPTFALFVALHLPVVATAVWSQGRCLRRGLVWMLRAALCTAVALAPWLLLHLPNYVGFGRAPDPHVQFPPREHIDIFSTAPLFYGASLADYTMLLALAMVAAIWGLCAALRPGASADRHRPLALTGAAVTSLLAYAILVWIAAPYEAGYEQSVRYVVPFLLGVVPLVAVMAAALPLPRRLSVGIPVVGLLASCAAFAPTLQERVAQALKHRNILACKQLAQMPAHHALNHVALSRAEAEKVRQLQEKIPVGEPFIAWITTPFHLDFSRNPVHDAESCGLGTPWAAPPEGIRYVIWEYAGVAVASPQGYASQIARSPGRLGRVNASRALAFVRTLQAAAGHGDRLYEDDRFVVFRLPAR